MPTATVTYVDYDTGAAGQSYGPYEVEDAPGAVFAYLKDPRAGLIRASKLQADGTLDGPSVFSKFRVEAESESYEFTIENYGCGCAVRDETGKVLGGKGAPPKETN